MILLVYLKMFYCVKTERLSDIYNRQISDKAIKYSFKSYPLNNIFLTKILKKHRLFFVVGYDHFRTKDPKTTIIQYKFRYIRIIHNILYIILFYSILFRRKILVNKTNDSYFKLQKFKNNIGLILKLKI